MVESIGGCGDVEMWRGGEVESWQATEVIPQSGRVYIHFPLSLCQTWTGKGKGKTSGSF